MTISLFLNEKVSYIGVLYASISILMQMENVIEPGIITTGIVYVKDNCIFYAPKSRQAITIAIADIAIMGEYSLNDHPLHKNHWYMAFVQSDGSWQSIPWFTENMQQLKEYLAFHFKTAFPITDLRMTLRGKSLIRYPETLKDRPLFHFIPPQGYKTPLTTWQKIMSFLRLGTYRENWRLELTDEVKAFLN